MQGGAVAGQVRLEAARPKRPRRSSLAQRYGPRMGTRQTAVWAALETFKRGRHPTGHWPTQDLPDEPGVVHAYRSTAVPRMPEFFDGDGPRAACGTRVLTRLGAPFNLRDPDACRECAGLVAQGVTSFATGRERDICRTVVQPGAVADGAAIGCRLLSGHQGAHRGPAGETWATGPDDFTPAPDGYV